MPRAKLARLSVEDLKKEIVRRQKALPKLAAKRDELDRQIAELEALGAAKPPVKRGRKAGGRRRVRGVRRAPRPGSLASTLVQVLKGKGRLRVAEIAEAAKAAGYKSKSKNFQTMVAMALSQGAQFKRVSRGVYKLKG